MDNRTDLQASLIRKQERYIRNLEDQLAVYEEKDRAQEQLIKELNQVLDIFAEEISRLKAVTEERKPEGEN